MPQWCVLPSSILSLHACLLRQHVCPDRSSRHGILIHTMADSSESLQAAGTGVRGGKQTWRQCPGHLLLAIQLQAQHKLLLSQFEATVENILIEKRASNFLSMMKLNTACTCWTMMPLLLLLDFLNALLDLHSGCSVRFSTLCKLLKAKFAACTEQELLPFAWQFIVDGCSGFAWHCCILCCRR